ncbi:MAG: carbon-phosphorus lyase complex subunit PhnI [Anaerolineae bacterium]|nr:carbon-phosphorus lyase complex subunit PhnI [Anaerolineae bacterium]
MVYVAAKGGEQAILHSEQLYHYLNGGLSLDRVRDIERHLPYLIDRVMGESSLYAPELAALALAQTGGDLYEAVLLLRAYRSTQPRVAYAEPVIADRMITLRRISAAFKDIPGGQILGPSLDYSHRLLRMDILDGAQDTVAPPAADATAKLASPTYPLVADWHRANGVLPHIEPDATDPVALPDITKDPLLMPAPRAHRLQSLARADSGGVLALGYSVMRGYGMSHPTVNELRLAHADVEIKHPVTGEVFSAGKVRVSQCEVVTEASSGKNAGHGKRIGFAATMGWNEVKIIAASTLDLAMNESDPHPAHNEEFVLYHTEAVESSGFCIHFKLPHYVTFASSMDALRGVMAQTYGGDAQAETASKEEPVSSAEAVTGK